MLLSRTKNEVIPVTGSSYSRGEEVVAEVHEKAQKLQFVTSEIELAEMQVTNLRAERERLLNENRDHNRLIRTQGEEVLKQHRAMSTLRSRAHTMTTGVVEKTQELEKIVANIDYNARQYELGGELLDKRHETIREATEELHELNKSITAVIEYLKQLKKQEREHVHKVNQLIRQEETIQCNIETAIENFRVFEARIAKFSEETGYIVGYPKIESLAESI